MGTFVIQSAGLAESWRTRPAFPTGTIYYARPTLVWPIEVRGAGHITSVQMSLNGRSVPAGYSAAKRQALYAPPQALAPGDYHVHCRVTIDGRVPVDENWQFQVAANALAELPAPDAAQRSGWETANALRAAAGLPALTLDPRLCYAALLHSRYLALNRVSGHDEQSGRPGYVAATPSARVQLYGYGEGSAEDVSFGPESANEQIHGLFDAPYHRRPFLQPGSPDFGSGHVGAYTTLEFGVSEGEAAGVWPYPGQTNVPVAWEPVEWPDPLRLYSDRPPSGQAYDEYRTVNGKTTHRHVGPKPVGYPITLFHYSDGPGHLAVRSATLTDSSGHPVPCYVNTPANDDHLPDGVILMAKTPLHPGTTYTATVQASADGHDVSRTWRFMTAQAHP
jgi:hypothetical protein